MNFYNNNNNIKFVDLPIQIGYLELPVDDGKRKETFGLNWFLGVSSSNLYDKLELDVGCTYYFNIYYNNMPLTFKNVPYDPVKFSVLYDERHFLSCSDMKNSVHCNEMTYDPFHVDGFVYQINKFGRQFTRKQLFTAGIKRMLWDSDLIIHISENDYDGWTLDINDGSFEHYGVNRNYILNLTFVYFKSSV